MPATHIVKSGEHIGSIARLYGFANYSPIWQHPNNASLKAKRKDPLVLAPGDELFIPDHVELVFTRATDASHDLRVNLDMFTLKLRLLDEDGQPRKNEEVRVRVETPEKGEASPSSERVETTDGDGNLSVEVASHVQGGTIEIDGQSYDLAVGRLDPVEADTGVAQRLANLGYLQLDDDEEVPPDVLRAAVCDFQADHGLDMTGEPSDIEDALEDSHGA